jgi:hypothetical protein
MFFCGIFWLVKYPGVIRWLWVHLPAERKLLIQPSIFNC